MDKSHIIIVEDELIIAQDIKNKLIKLGYAVSAIAASGEDALKKIEAHQPDLVLMEIKLRDEMDDIEAAGQVHALFDVPVVYMTASADKETVKRAKKIGPYGFIYKPVQVDVLRAVIEIALYKHGMEKKLKEREAKMRSIFRAAPMGIGVVSNRVILEVNDRFCEITGYSSAELIGKNARMMYPTKEDYEYVGREKYRQIEERGTGTVETRFKRKDGKIIDVLLSSTPLDPTDLTAGVTFTALDITERKKAEEALKRSEEKFRTLAEQSPNMIFINKMGRVVYANEKSAEVLGYTREEFYSPDFGFLTLIAPESVETVKSAFGKHMKGEEVEPYEYALITKDRKRIEVIITPKLIDYEGERAILGIVTDITGRKRAEQMMENSEKRLKILFEFAPDAYYMNDLKGTFIDGNKAAEELLGYKREELIGKNFTKLDLLSLKEMPKALKALAKNARGQGTGPDEFSLKRKDGNTVQVEIRTHPVKISDKIVVLGIARDITDRKQAEQVKAATYSISEAAMSAEDLEGLFHSIHDTIGVLMPAKNFYISFYDYKSQMLSFPYFVDEFEEQPESYKAGKGLTEYVLRSGQPLLISPQVFEELVKKGEVESIGPPSVDWLGVPLRTKDRTMGVLVVQSYTEGLRYGEEEKNILRFVSTQIAMAIERKQAEEQILKDLKVKEVLLKEIHHRVKNNLNVITSLLSLQSKRISNKEQALAAFEETRNRIFSMALVHEQLYKSDDFSKIDMKPYIEVISQKLKKVHAFEKDIALDLVVNRVFLDVNHAVPCGLILNELITNVFKHAFTGRKTGDIKISFRVLKDKSYQLTVQDNGVGLPEKVDIENAETLGHQLVKILTEQIDGKLEIRRNKGTAFIIRFSVENG